MINRESLSRRDKISQSGDVPRLSQLCPLLISGLALALSAEAENKTPDLNAVWDYASNSQPIAARNVLDDLEGLDVRTEKLAHLVLGLARAPISEGDWAKIEPALAKLAQGDDEVASRALYLQARMHQVHLLKPDYARAEELYRELNTRWPGSHWAELGLVKLGMVKLYALEEPADVGVRFTEVEALLAQIQTPTLRRDLHLQMGWAGLFHRRHLDEVLPHLIAADEIGGMMGITPEDVMIQIGELSFRAGHLDQAKAYFERFLREVRSNTKRFNVRQQLKAVNEAIAEREGAA